MPVKTVAQPFAEAVDKLTRSIENAVTGESFPTAVLAASAADLRQLQAKAWVFDWRKEARQAGQQLFKLVTQKNPGIVHGFISLRDAGDHLFMALVESAAFNRGK